MQATAEEQSLDRTGGAIYLGMVLLAVLISWLTSATSLSAGKVVLIGLATATYIAVDQIADRWQIRRGLERLPAAYFLLQFAIASAIIGLFAASGVIAVSWLLFMPLLARGLLSSSRLTFALLASGALLVVLIAVWKLSGGSAVLQAAFGFAAASAFVYLITEMAVHEKRARAESARLAAELSAANRRLSDYAMQVEELAINRERNRLAREIHDGLGHALTTISMQLEAAKTLLPDEVERAIGAVDAAQQQAREGLGEVRRSVAALRITPLDGNTLTTALEELVRVPDDELHPAFSVSGTPRPLSFGAELTLYRVAQEALTNMRRHSAATKAAILLHFDDSSGVRLRVEDDGRGAAAPAEGFGLVGIRERVSQLGGEVRIETAVGRGFSLEVMLPV